MLYTKSPNGNTKSINLDTMNIVSSSVISQTGWTKLPNGILMQWGYEMFKNDMTWHTFTLPLSFNDIFCVVGSSTFNKNIISISMSRDNNLRHIEIAGADAITGVASDFTIASRYFAIGH